MSTRPDRSIEFPVTGEVSSDIARVLPIVSGKTPQQKLVSDSTALRVSTALQASLHVKDVIHAFANEIRRIVRDVSVRYRNRARQILVEDGNSQIHRCSYELTLLGDSLGEMVFTRAQSLSDHDQELLEVLLCALIYPLRNTLLYEQALTGA